MKIQSMFANDVNRKINGVVKVNQTEDDVLVQELDEYVVTNELKKHFITFFNNYNESFDQRITDVGVWITGFFGSGKSHFLKMLSYLLENRVVQGVKTVERFREKFADDPGTFMLIDRATRGETQTILFNIDIENERGKDETAVLRTFSKMFYNLLGFHGKDLKVVKLEQFVEKQGKTEEFRRAFEKKRGMPWKDARKTFALCEDEVVSTMQETLGMSEQAARNWFNGTEASDLSVAEFVADVKEYVDSKPDDFRLLFMVDEVGQFVGGDGSLLLNLQSIVEEIGSKCAGKVWIVCTGQEAIDEVIKARENEFSRIQARFHTRLSLSSASADEVIQKRILAKTEKADKRLEDVYETNESVLKNLFTFTDSVRDIRGYDAPGEFAKNFPFVPYQFILTPKVYAEIRKHGNSGKHLSGGERSMLSGFQEAAQKLEEKDEFALAPFYLFYDSVHTFLDSSIRRVVERCARAAEKDAGIKPEDVDVLKLLYLIRYVDDVKANLENIVILMADDVRMDKVVKREQVRASLERLLKENYIGRSGDSYNFLTDEEQDIQREIKNTPVATAEIVGRIAQMIFDDLYKEKKFRYANRYDFAFDRMVDEQTVGAQTGGLTLRVLTDAVDPVEKEPMRLMVESKGKAIILLAENSYYDSLERSEKIRKYVKQRNVSQLASSVQDILRARREEAETCEQTAAESLRQAILDAILYVDGERIEIKENDVKTKINKALEFLVERVYDKLDLITDFVESDADLSKILSGEVKYLPGQEPNTEAAAAVEKYLETQAFKSLPTTAADIQSRFQSKPYGWREIDVAAVVARLVYERKVIVKYAGTTIQPTDPKLPEALRKKTEIGKTTISKREAIPLAKIRRVRDFARDFFDVMDVPESEDDLVDFIAKKFDSELTRYSDLDAKYAGHNYPDRNKVKQAIELINDVLSQRKDNFALINRLIERETALDDMRDDLQDVEDFFKTRVAIFDAAVERERKLSVDGDYLAKDEDARRALEEIRSIIAPPDGKFPYARIPELNGLMAKATNAHEVMLEKKREELREIIRQCAGDVRALDAENPTAETILNDAEAYWSKQEAKIDVCPNLALLDGLATQVCQFKDETVARVKASMIQPPKPEPTPPSPTPQPKPQKKVVKTVYRQAAFPAETLTSEAEIDKYVEKIRAKLKESLKGCDGVELK